MHGLAFCGFLRLQLLDRVEDAMPDCGAGDVTIFDQLIGARRGPSNTPTRIRP